MRHIYVKWHFNAKIDIPAKSNPLFCENMTGKSKKNTKKERALYKIAKKFSEIKAK